MVGLTHCQIVVAQVYLLLYFGVNETVVTEKTLLAGLWTKHVCEFLVLTAIHVTGVSQTLTNV